MLNIRRAKLFDASQRFASAGRSPLWTCNLSTSFNGLSNRKIQDVFSSVLISVQMLAAVFAFELSGFQTKAAVYVSAGIAPPAACFSGQQWYNCGMNTFIYGLVCPVTNAIRYVGKSNNPIDRFSQHKHNCLVNTGYDNKHLMRWWRKLSSSGLCPRMVILEEVPSERWKECEKQWISKFENLCNKHEGGIEPPSALGRKMSDATKAKLSAIRKGNPGWKIHPALGVASPLRGRPLSAEHKEKLSKIRLANNWMRGRKLSPERIAQIKESNRKKVCLIDSEGVTIEEFDSLDSASKSLSVSAAAISRVCSGEYTHTHGKKFRYA